MKLGIVAYGDESIQRACEPSRYLLAATIYAEGTDPSFALRRAKPSGASKLHWYDLDPKRQAASLEVVSSVPQQTTIVAALPLEGTKPERARRKALEEIVRRLIDMGVRKLVLESRNDTHDKRDRELLVSMRRRGEALDFDLEHVPGKDEPLLWSPTRFSAHTERRSRRVPAESGRILGGGLSGPSTCARCPRDSARAGAHDTQDCRLSLPFPLGGGF